MREVLQNPSVSRRYPPLLHASLKAKPGSISGEALGLIGSAEISDPEKSFFQALLVGDTGVCSSLIWKGRDFELLIGSRDGRRLAAGRSSTDSASPRPQPTLPPPAAITQCINDVGAGAETRRSQDSQLNFSECLIEGPPPSRKRPFDGAWPQWPSPGEAQSEGKLDLFSAAGSPDPGEIATASTDVEDSLYNRNHISEVDESSQALLERAVSMVKTLTLSDPKADDVLRVAVEERPNFYESSRYPTAEFLHVIMRGSESYNLASHYCQNFNSNVSAARLEKMGLDLINHTVHDQQRLQYIISTNYAAWAYICSVSLSGEEPDNGPASSRHRWEANAQSSSSFDIRGHVITRRWTYASMLVLGQKGKQAQFEPSFDSRPPFWLR
ncbi:hypothetical protein G7054_g13132 [Neopestalotiopsis clavispora]|nr:hypothetical protein G7054_g13132 [Neopestalotiopsis clavispora]